MDTQPINLNNLDKSTWLNYRFDEIAKNISERVDPNNTDLLVYIGLEHIDSESIHIKRHGTPDDVNGQKLRCYPDDVIFGRRRAYQRKAAIATMDGFCSAHSLVLRANPDVIEPKLFPFFLHSDLFMHRAVDISVGSLSPTINWGTLKHQEFMIPPKHQQAQLAELLWAMDEVIEMERISFLKAKSTLFSAVNEKCLNIEGNVYYLSDIINKLEAGVSVNSVDGSIDATSKGILKTSAVSEGLFKPKEVKKVVGDEIKRLKTTVKKDSILISRMNTVELVGANAYVDTDFPNLYLPDRLWQTCISKKFINTKYLWFILSSQLYRRKISELCSGTSNSMKNISKKEFLELKVKLPNKDEQDNAVKKLEAIENCLKKHEDKISNSIALQKSLINQIF
jgi:type I restriction enzyme S subunit